MIQAELLVMKIHKRLTWDSRGMPPPADMVTEARAIIARAEAAEGEELHPMCRGELLREETGWYSDEIEAVLRQIKREDETVQPL